MTLQAPPPPRNTPLSSLPHSPPPSSSYGITSSYIVFNILKVIVYIP